MHDQASQNKTFLRAHWLVICILAIAEVLLIASHWTHVFGILPYLLILACPLMHVFMMRAGHGHNHDESEHYEEHGKRLKDLVCGMEPTDKVSSNYKGQVYSFCSNHCREEFEKEPERYMRR